MRPKTMQHGRKRCANATLREDVHRIAEPRVDRPTLPCIDCDRFLRRREYVLAP